MTIIGIIASFIFGLIGFSAVYCGLIGKWPDENDYQTLRFADCFAIVVITGLIVVLGYVFFFS